MRWSTWPEMTAVPSGLCAHDTTNESVEYSVAGLFDRSWPTFILPSAKPKTSSFGRDSGQQMHVMEEPCWNLLQIDFLSPHSAPSLYTNTILSLCATASFDESGDQAIPRTTYVFVPLASAGFVENLSRRSPRSSHRCTTRSVVTIASRRLLADQQMPVTFAMPSCGAWMVLRCRLRKRAVSGRSEPEGGSGGCGHRGCNCDQGVQLHEHSALSAPKSR